MIRFKMAGWPEPFGSRSASEASFIGNGKEPHKGRAVDFEDADPYCRCRRLVILFVVVASRAGLSGLQPELS
jgi:hypothetical protein